MDETKQTAETGSEEGGDQRQQQIVDMGSSTIRTERGTIHTLTIVGQNLVALDLSHDSQHVDGPFVRLYQGGPQIYDRLYDRFARLLFLFLLRFIHNKHPSYENSFLGCTGRAFLSQKPLLYFS